MMTLKINFTILSSCAFWTPASEADRILWESSNDDCRDRRGQKLLPEFGKVAADPRCVLDPPLSLTPDVGGHCRSSLPDPRAFSIFAAGPRSPDCRAPASPGPRPL